MTSILQGREPCLWGEEQQEAGFPRIEPLEVDVVPTVEADLRPVEH